MASFLVMCFASLLVGSCAVAPPPPDTGQDIVLVKTRRLTERWGPILGQAHHAVIDLREDGHWYRVAVDDADSGAWIYPITTEEALAEDYEGRPYTILQRIDGPRAGVVIADLHREVARYAQTYHYGAWPGPNSNTFIEEMGRRVPGLRFDQHHDAFCKDYVAGIYIGSSATGTGFSLETPVLGIQVGPVDGLELHLMSLTLGIQIWPPRLELPFLPRIGS
ncbi:MAG: DUF3750 domain-containing protein [Planctomycetota bacterium]